MIPVLNVTLSPSGCPITKTFSPSLGGEAFATGCTNVALPFSRGTQSKSRSKLLWRATTSAVPHVPEAIAISARDPPLVTFHVGSSSTWRAVTNKYPSALACNKVPAPKLAVGISSCVSHDRRAGEITATKGFSFTETSFADIGIAVGKLGKVCSSSSLNPAPATDGSGAKENTRTVASEVTIPLTMSSVASNEVHSCRVRGGSPRIATRNTIATRHSSGNSSTSGARAHFTHRGTAGANFGSSRAG